MVTIERRQYCIDINEYAEQYIQRLRQGSTKLNLTIDAGYLRDVISELGNFAALLRIEGLNDIGLLYEDMHYAETEQSQFESFGDYCYELMHEAFDKTNICLSANNELHAKLSKVIDKNQIDINVATNYIAFNMFGSGNILELTNFRRATGIGLCYDINLRQTPILTSNIQEEFTPKLDKLIIIAEILSMLKNHAAIFNDIDEWSAQVNDKAIEGKIAALPAWNATYQTYKEAWNLVEFTKQNASTFCTMSIVKENFTEQLFKAGKIKHFNYGKDFRTLLNLDYINYLNFDFK